MTGQASSPPSIEPLTMAPPFLTPQEHDAATSATPTSFADIPPCLVLGLEGVTVLIDPAISVGDAQVSGALKGEMWATEGALSFLPSSATSAGGATGFSLPYPLIVLHAVSTSVPASINSAEGGGARRSIYCQIELPGGEEGDEDENDEGEGLREMWIVPAQDGEVDTLFQSLSHCASLHPSLQDGEDDDGGNPFAGMGPFGTGLAGGSSSGQFDDVNGSDGDGQELSEAGRANLDRFEAMLGGDGDDDDEEDYADADEEQPSSTSSSSNLLMLRTLPHPYPSLFTAPLLSSLLALLDAYAPLVGWDPSPEEGTMHVVFDNRKDAERRVTDGDIEKVKEVLDGLELEVIGGEADEQQQQPCLSVQVLPNSIDVASLLPRGLNHPAAPSTISTSTTTSAPAPLRRRQSFAPSDLLQPPNTDRNFLISPPGSPPIGWEPIREDPPNRETLAGDLIEALMRLSGDGGGRRESDGEEEEEKEERGQVSSTKASSTTNSPKPGEVKVVLQSDEQGGGPVVTVQSFDDDDDGQEAAGSTSRPDITQVKATVESMTGGSDDFGLAAGADGAGGGKRITPTGRPPLA